MKKLFVPIITAAFFLMLTGCETKEERTSRIFSEIREERESSLKEESISREAEIEEIDEWGVSLDDVDRLAKAAIRKHENMSDYRRDYNKAIRVTDEFLEDIENTSKGQYDLGVFIKNYKESCDAGIEYLKSCVDVELLYDLYLSDDEFDKTEKNLIRISLTMFNNSIKAIEQSKSDMEELLKPINEENRTLTDDELEKVYEIYQVLTDKVGLANIY